LISAPDGHAVRSWTIDPYLRRAEEGAGGGKKRSRWESSEEIKLFKKKLMIRTEVETVKTGKNREVDCTAIFPDE